MPITVGGSGREELLNRFNRRTPSNRFSRAAIFGRGAFTPIKPVIHMLLRREELSINRMWLAQISGPGPSTTAGVVPLGCPPAQNASVLRRHSKNLRHHLNGHPGLRTSPSIAVDVVF